MLIGDSELEMIRAHQPEIRPEKSLMKAAVAVILRETEQGSEFLMMQRAKVERDPWSGQMAFPGGKIDPEDESPKAAAIREAHEEVGVCLTEQEYVGQFLYGLKVDGIFSVHVSCFVFNVQRPLELVGNHEVADMVWLPFNYLREPNNAHAFHHPQDPSVKMPAVMIDADKEQVLWGLSLRMLAMLHELLGWPMPVLSKQDQQHLKDIEKRDLKRVAVDELVTTLVNKRN